MTSFLVEKKNQKSFAEKTEKLSIKTRQNIEASKNSLDRFCQDYYDGRTLDDIFRELQTLKGDKQTQAVRDVLQSWIDWQYNEGSLTNSVKQYVSKIKRVFLHNNIKIHIEDFDEPLEYKPVTKEELHELTLEEIQKIFSVALPRRTGFYLALISTGARPGELLQVRKKDIDTTQKRIKIRIEAENTKTRSGRSVWLTKEAGRFLMVRLKNLKENDLVWATNENPAFAEKAIYDFIPEARHMKTWFLGDYQNPDDLYAGVRYQANIVVIKRASRNILGSDWTWLFEKIERDRMGLLRKAGKRIERPEEMWQYERYPQIKKYLDDRRPRIDEMADNIGYLTFINGEVARWRFDMPSFHHKMSLEDFQKDTGITWTINTKKAPKEPATTTSSHHKKKIKENILKKIDYMHETEGKSFKQIKDELVQMQTDGEIPNMSYEDREPIYFNNLWNRWKKNFT